MGGHDAVVVSGGTGLVGGRLTAALGKAGRPVRVLSRAPSSVATKLGPEIAALAWDGIHPEPAQLADAAAVVHLAGEPIFAGRLNAARRRRIRRSRIDSTDAVVHALAKLPASRRPELLLCASAVGYYGDRGEERLDEDSGAGTGFLAEVCRDWEAAADGARALSVRVVQLRLGVVLAREGGALPTMARAFRLCAGGRLGDGRQWFPWIHIDDAVALILAMLDDSSFSGPINATSPEPVRNAEFTRALARQVKRPALLPVPAFALRAALGELSGELLGSRHVTPARALAGGVKFALPGLVSALAHELG